MSGKIVDLEGKQFGKLKLVKQVERPEHLQRKAKYWLCQCECGNKTIISTGDLTSKIRSCGCGHRHTNSYDLLGEYGIGYTHNTNQPFYFDLNDYDLVKNHCWSENANGYIFSYKSNGIQNIHFHRLVMNPKKENVVDHINHDKKDNRKNNLRECTHQQNMQNSKQRKNNKSGYKGIYWDIIKRNWLVQISINGTVTTIGRYKSKEDAIVARKEAEQKYFGEFAYRSNLEVGD